MKYLLSTLIALPVVGAFALFVLAVLEAPYFMANLTIFLLLSYALGSKVYDRWILPKMSERPNGPFDGQGLSKAVRKSGYSGGLGPR